METSSNPSGGGIGGVGAVLPPRPFEIDQNETSTPLSPSRSAIRFNRHSKTDEDQGSDDGTLPPIDNGHEDGFIDRTGATGGSVVAALGRALTVRRNRNTSNKSIDSAVTKEEEEGSWKVDKLMEDKNVKAALDFSKTKSVYSLFLV